MDLELLFIIVVIIGIFLAVLLWMYISLKKGLD